MNFRIVRLLIIASYLFGISPFTINAQNVLDKKISVSFKETELRKILESIQKQANVYFVYSPNTIDDSKKVNLDLNDKPLKVFFSEFLASYGISNKLLSDNKFLLFLRQVKKKDLNDESSSSEIKAGLLTLVTGTIRDSIGNPVEGVTIIDENSKSTAVSDTKGLFTIHVPDKNTTLKFKHIGYATIMKGVDNNGVVNVSMFEVAEVLNDVVIIGYGSVRKKDLTGAVSKVNISELVKAPVRSFDEALAGRIAGVQVSSMDGQIGRAHV